MKEPSKYWIELAKMSGRAKKPVEPRVEALVSRPNYVLDLERADGGARKNQNQWIDHYNAEGRIMASAPDVYNAVKDADGPTLDNLREDSKNNWLVSSTRIAYQPDNLNAKITHYFGSNQTDPKITRDVRVPHLGETPLEKVLSNKHGLNFVQVLFGTEDEPEEITHNLETLSEKPSNEIYFWTPGKGNRKSYPERSVIFYCDVVDFLVNCYGHPGGGDGFSRGVHER